MRDPANDDTAFAKVADRLLASPRFGECWVRHWLFLGYAGAQFRWEGFLHAPARALLSGCAACAQSFGAEGHREKRLRLFVAFVTINLVTGGAALRRLLQCGGEFRGVAW